MRQRCALRPKEEGGGGEGNRKSLKAAQTFGFCVVGGTIDGDPILEKYTRSISSSSSSRLMGCDSEWDGMFF